MINLLKNWIGEGVLIILLSILYLLVDKFGFDKGLIFSWYLITVSWLVILKQNYPYFKNIGQTKIKSQFEIERQSELRGKIWRFNHRRYDTRRY